MADNEEMKNEQAVRENTGGDETKAAEKPADEKPADEKPADNSETADDAKTPESDSSNKKKKKKQKKLKDDELPRNPLDDQRDLLTLRRRAKEAKRYVLMMRVAALIAVILIVLVTAGYAISYFYNKYGSFTIKVNKYDMVHQGLSVSETPEYERSEAVLNADIIYDMTNISGEDLPDNIDMVNGSHNGDNYIAYTFYVHNAGEDTLTYQGDLIIESTTKGVDEAIRVAVFYNGEKTVYGKTKSNGGGKESDCDSEFLTATQVMRNKVTSFSPGRADKYTVVIWLEGNDPDCVNKIIGGTMKLSMNFKIIEDT